MGRIILKSPTCVKYPGKLGAGFCMLLFSFLSFNAYAQNQVVYEDVIQLKNTEKIRGQITDSIAGVSVNIRLHNQTLRTVARSDIYKILREPYKEDAVYRKQSKRTSVEYEDVILLSTAEVLRGKITNNIPDKSVTILLNDSTTRTVERSEISQILIERKRDYSSESSKSDEYPNQPSLSESESDVQGIIELGYGFDNGKNELNAIRLNVVVAAGLEGVISLGGGVGIRIIAEDHPMVVPLFVDFRASPIQGATSPFLGLSIGSAIQTEENSDMFSGVFVHAQLGVEISKRKKSGVMLSVGYEQFEVQIIEPSNYFYFYSFQPKVKKIEAITVNLAFRF